MSKTSIGDENDARPVDCPLEIVRFVGSSPVRKGQLVEVCTSGACFLSPVHLAVGDIVSLRTRISCPGGAQKGYQKNPEPPFQVVTSQVVRCDPLPEGDFPYNVSARYLFRYF